MATTTRRQRIIPSPEQMKVITHGDSHLQVVACAGSGKTEAISRRVAKLIVRGVEPSSIIAFTFTERAAASLKARIVSRVAEKKGSGFLDRLGPMYVGTIHAYCLRLLQDHVPKYANFDILDEHRLAGLLSREYRRLELHRLGDRHWRPILGFLRNVDVVENELIDADKLGDTDFGKCYRAYCEMLERYRCLTYGQLITRAVAALEDRKTYKQVHGRLKHLVVDEYQDINPAQERLIRLLGKRPVCVCVVGDDDQAIYQWRGSTVENMLNFRRRYRGATRLSLSKNRRSRPEIIKTANGFVQTISPRLTKEMKRHRKDFKPAVHCWSGETAENEGEVIAETIASLVDRGYRYRDVGILLRSVRTSSPPIIAALQEYGIPFRCGGRTGLFLQPEAQAFGKVFAWLSDNGWKPEHYAPSAKVSLDDIVDEFAELFSPGKTSLRNLKKRLGDWHNAAHDDKKPANLVGGYYRLLRVLGVHQWDLSDPFTAARMGALARFSQLLADFEHVTRRGRWVREGRGEVFRGGQDRGPWYYKRLFNYLQFYALDAYDDFEGEETFDLDVVDILTVHQAKGLEWPVVFVPCLVKRRFPSMYAGKEQKWLVPDAVFPKDVRQRYEGSTTDERRLFYVAMTRARDMLYLSRFQRKKQRFGVSQFLEEVAGGDPDLQDQLPLPPPFSPEENGEMEKASLSFSEIASYESCPLSYRLTSLLGFQPQLVPEIGYGKAIHHILRRVADFVRDEKRLPEGQELENLFRSEFYLPLAQKTTFERLQEAAEMLVDTYLKKYNDDLFRVWETERPFELHLGNGIVSGRADVILDREGGQIGSMALVDYKTATDASSDDVYAFQLAIYTAAGRGEGIDVRAAYLHDLGQSDRVDVPVADDCTHAARQRADQLVQGITSRQFDAVPDRRKCRGCDVRFVCDHGPAR